MNKSIKINPSFENLLNEKKKEYQAKKNHKIVDEWFVFYGGFIALEIQTECENGTHFDIIKIGKLGK